jgi:hypothetical protein
MKKVLSVEAFIEERREDGDTEESISIDLNFWANKFEGFTRAAMENAGLTVNENWMVEVEEDEDPTDYYEEMQIKRHDDGDI